MAPRANWLPALKAMQPFSLPIILNTCGAQPGKPMLIDRALPGQKLVDSELIALTGFFHAEQAAANSGHHLRLTANNPTLRISGRKVCNRQRAPIGPDDIAHPRSHLFFGHDTHYTLADPFFVIAQHD